MEQNVMLGVFLNEFIFAKVMDEMEFSVSQGRDCHGKLMGKLKESLDVECSEHNRIAYLSKKRLLQLLLEVTGEYKSRLTAEELEEIYSSAKTEFEEKTHISAETAGSSIASGKWPFESRKGKSMLPVTPYMERYMYRDTILEHGAEILYAGMDKLLEIVQPSGEQKGTLRFKNPEQEAEVLFCVCRDGSYNAVGRVYASADRNGLARLKPYMSVKEYREICDWMEPVPEQEQMSLEDVGIAVAILETLREKGISYTVEKRFSEGNAVCFLDRLNCRITLLTLRSNKKWIGNLQYTNGGNIYNSYLYSLGNEHLLSESAIKNHILYSLGYPVQRRDDSDFAGGITVNDRFYQNGAYVGSESYRMKKKAGVRGSMPMVIPSTYTSYAAGGKHQFLTNAFYIKRDPERESKSILEGVASTLKMKEYKRVKFIREEDAEEFLKNAVDCAGKNFRKAIDIEYLLEEYREHVDENQYEPAFSSMPFIGEIQESCWKVLTGNAEADFVSEFSGNAEEKIRSYLNSITEKEVGQFEPDSEGKRFCPGMVARFMDMTRSEFDNSENLITAMKFLKWQEDELSGTDYSSGIIKYRLLRFDRENCRRMKDCAGEFMKRIFETVVSAVRRSGCSIRDDQIWIDENGVVCYQAEQYYFDKVKISNQIVEGVLGQIFEPDADGVVETKFKGLSNQLFTPGYMAYVLPQKQGEDKTLEERTRYRGYDQILIENIQRQIRWDLTGEGKITTVLIDGKAVPAKTVGDAVSINDSYRGLYSTTYPVSVERKPEESLKEAYIRECAMIHLPKKILEARFATSARLVRFPTKLREESTINAAYRYQQPEFSDYDSRNDNVITSYELTGHRNLSVMTEEGDGYFDKTATGTARNQGIIRYATEGAIFTADGRLIPAADKEDRTPLMKLDIMRNVEYTPFDRQQMVFMNLMCAIGVSEPVGMALMTLGGRTFDDGVVISRDFAHAYGVVGEDGEPRDLVIGDKLCDFAGNKSVIADIIDREMDLETARETVHETEVALFKANPQLDVVMAPYSACSRFNGGSARFLMENPQDLILPDGSVKEGCMGFAPVIITDMKVDEKTTLYDEEEVKRGRGRKISSQLAWAFCAKNAQEIMTECYYGNNRVVMDYREMLITMGLDMDEKGTLAVGYHPHTGEQRAIFRLPSEGEIKSIEIKELKERFQSVLDERGGFMEVPFDLKYPTGETLQEVPAEKAACPGQKTWYLPVLSAHLRAGQELVDGEQIAHNYTVQYARIWQVSLEYLKNRLDGAAQKKACDSLKRDAQSRFNKITMDLRERRFKGKHNFMRDGFMSHRMPFSASAVWTPDPSLDIDQVAMNSGMMKTLGVEEGQYVLLWRDPILREEGVRYMRVKLCDGLTGVAVNPLIAVAFDGDFDGDSVGMYALKTRRAQKEALRLFSIENTILDETNCRPEGGFAMILNDGMDVKSAEYRDEQKKVQAEERGEAYGPTLAERRKDIEDRLNEVYQTEMPDKERFKRNHTLIRELSKWAKDTLLHTCGTAIVSYKDLKAHGDSILEIVQSKAKGSMSKAGEYFRYLGVEFEKDEDGNILTETFRDAGKTRATREDMISTETATAIKTFGTGIAGTVSQRLMAAGRNSCASAGLRLTYNATQGILQAKHDADLALQQYNMLQSTLRKLWKGYSLNSYTTAEGKTAWAVNVNRSANGVVCPLQATKEEWIKEFMEIHNSPDGMNVEGCVNPAHVRVVADALCDPADGKMLNIESQAVKERLAAPMDLLAYGGSFETLVKLAKDGRNLFEGKYNRMFAPRCIRKNWEADAAGEELRALVKDDVLEPEEELEAVNAEDAYIPESEETPAEEAPEMEEVIAAERPAEAEMEMSATEIQETEVPLKEPKNEQLQQLEERVQELETRVEQLEKQYAEMMGSIERFLGGFLKK